MPKVSLKGVCDMHVHTNPDLRLRAYNDFELAEAAIRVGARGIVIKSHQGFTANRAFLTNEYVKRVHGDNTGFTMYGSVTMNKSVGGINPSAEQRSCGCRHSQQRIISAEWATTPTPESI